MAGAGGSDKGKVMIAMDGSEHSYQAFHFYVNSVHKTGDEVLIAHCPDYKNVVRTPVISTDPSVIASVVKHCEDEEKKLVAHIQEALKETGIAAQIVTLHGEPGSAIVKASRDNHATLIVTGSRGLGALRRTVLGSVSSYILHHSHIPVLICREHKDT